MIITIISGRWRLFNAKRSIFRCQHGGDWVTSPGPALFRRQGRSWRRIDGQSRLIRFLWDSFVFDTLMGGGGEGEEGRGEEEKEEEEEEEGELINILPFVKFFV